MEQILEPRADPRVDHSRAGSEPRAGSSASWPAIIAGAFVATAVSLALFALGSGLGLAAISPWPGRGITATTFAVTTSIWLIVMQWVSSAIGGYITGRLRTRWVGTHTHEVFFRDTAHGLVMWAVATVMIAAITAMSAHTASDIASVNAAVPSVGAVPDTDAANKAAAKAAAEVAIYTALSMVVGAFIASVSAAVGGRLRDEHL